MKKLAIALIALILLVMPLSAGIQDRNGQKVFSIGSGTWETMRDLYVAHGLALPSTTGPWSRAELDLMLSRIDYEALSVNEKAVYDALDDEIHGKARFEIDDSFALSIGADAAVDMRVHTDPEDFDDPDIWGGKGDWFYPDPLFRIPAEVWASKFFYAYMDFDIQGCTRPLDFKEGHSLGDMYIRTNIPKLTPHTKWNGTMNFPYKAFVSVGGEKWNLYLGRDKVSWGPGITGNFLIGDHLPFVDNARAQVFTDHFKYTFFVSSFYHPMNYVKETHSDGIDYLSLSRNQNDDKEGIRLFLAHRFEFRLGRIFNAAITESIMYQSEDAVPDLSILNPMMVLHNLYIRANSNSLLGIEMDFALAPHWNLYMQMAIDEMNEPDSPDEPPIAVGYMLGARTGYALGGGMLSAALEMAYTDPNFYLRDDGSYKGDKYGVNFVVGNLQLGAGDKFTLDWLGYRWGGDAAAASFKIDYDSLKAWKIGSEATYVAHGTFDINTRPHMLRPGDYPCGLTTKNENGSYEEGVDTAKRNAISHTAIFSVSGEYEFPHRITLSSEMDSIAIWNAGNMKGVNQYDFQFTLALKWQI